MLRCAALPARQVNFHTTLSGEAMVTLIYHKKLDGRWEEAARGLQAALAAAPAASATPSVIGRSRCAPRCTALRRAAPALIAAPRLAAPALLPPCQREPGSGCCAPCHPSRPLHLRHRSSFYYNASRAMAPTSEHAVTAWHLVF